MAMILHSKFAKQGRCADPSCSGQVSFSTSKTALICPICRKHLSIKEFKPSNNDYNPSSPLTTNENIPAPRQSKDEPKLATSSAMKMGPEKPNLRKRNSSNQTPLDIHDKELRSFKRIIYLESMKSSNPSSGIASLGMGDKKGHFNNQIERAWEAISLDDATSLYDTDVVYSYINGRRYCGEYYMPNDEVEQTRMMVLHSVYLYLLGGRLTTAPLENPTMILDVGTGCGDWALSIGEEYPGATVIGTDIAQIQPSTMPLNVYFELDDAEAGGGWTFGDDAFDLIHFRTMVGAFTDWNHIYKETYRHLKAGGWVEVMDFDDYEGILQFFPPGSQIEPWLAAVAEGCRRSRRLRGIKHLEHQRLTDLGFVDVSTEEYSIPMGIWPDDVEAKKIGKMFLLLQMCGVEALSLRVLTEQMGWDPDEVRKISEIISDEVKTLFMDSETARGLGFKIRVMKGRKPTAAKQDQPHHQRAEKDHGGESMATIRKRKNARVQDEAVK